MDHYSHADRTALPRAVARLLAHCDCRADAPPRRSGSPARPPGCRPGGDTRRLRVSDDTTYCAFEAGSGIEVSPTGEISHYRAIPAGARGGMATEQLVAPRNGTAASQLSRIDVDPVSVCRGAEAPVAPLPAGFRVCRVGGGRPPDVRFGVPARGAGGIRVRTESRPVGELFEGRLKIPRDAFGSSSPPHNQDIEQDLEPILEAHEDGFCLRALDGLGESGEEYEYRWSSTLGELAGFVDDLGSARPRALRLDTVFVNYGMYLTLFANDTRTPSWTEGYPFHDGRRLYQNMSVLGGIAFLHHPGIPPEGAFAMSSRQGPVFAHGPSSVRCTEGEIEVTRRCDIVEPPPCAKECPWGVRFGVVRDHEADGEWPEGE